MLTVTTSVVKCEVWILLSGLVTVIGVVMPAVAAEAATPVSVIGFPSELVVATMSCPFAFVLVKPKNLERDADPEVNPPEELALDVMGDDTRV